jgi:hypothetical protein
MAWKLAGVAVLVMSGAAWAQKEYPEPPARPAPIPIPATTTGTKQPEQKDDSIPGLEDADFRLSAAPLRREGSFIIRQRGFLVKLPGGEHAFVFHKDAAGKAERPMVLLPCLTLQSMEQTAGERSEPTAFLITGQVYAYYNVNFLLPTAAPIAGASVPAASGEKPASPDASTLKDPDVQDLIHELESQHDRPRTLSSVSKSKEETKTSDAPKAGNVDLLPEGSTISRRRGRLIRLQSGEWAFAMDNGTAGTSSTDRAWVLNPCTTLQRMEAWAAQLGENATLQLSGRMYQFGGRNHIIPTMFQVSPPNELTPRQ